ncbi:MAG: hydroxyquinol 1,2-dioxygenase [Candidatus Dormibacteria bacterium]
MSHIATRQVPRTRIVPAYVTRFGSLDQYEKGGVEIIDDDPKRYTFSNVFDVAAHSQPYEKVAVGKNRQYVLEAIRAEGDSDWRGTAHDEFALVMDGEVEVVLHRLTVEEEPPEGTLGSIALGHEPKGPRMGRVIARRGHMTMLPAHAAYRFHADKPSVMLLQTIEGADTVYRWGEICQTH